MSAFQADFYKRPVDGGLWNKPSSVSQREEGLPLFAASALRGGDKPHKTCTHMQITVSMEIVGKGGKFSFICIEGVMLLEIKN